MPAGRHALYGDIVHENGFPETAVTRLELPQIAGRPLPGDDAGGAGPPLVKADYNSLVAPLSEGYRMVWERGRAAYHARQHYMGMQGHAAFVRSDRSVFAHVHPSGTVPMAALGLTAEAGAQAGHQMTHSGLPAEVSFPYGFPKAGAYRIFVQVKSAGKVETGIFDTRVEN
jgi:hypothetical protein